MLHGYSGDLMHAIHRPLHRRVGRHAPLPRLSSAINGVRECEQKLAIRGAGGTAVEDAYMLARDESRLISDEYGHP